MGREIVYCAGCGRSLRERDFEQGRAHLQEIRPWCGECRAVPAPPPVEKPRRPTPGRVRALPPPGRRSPLPWIAAGAAALLAGIAGLVAASGEKPGPTARIEMPPVDAPKPVVAVPKPEPPRPPPEPPKPKPEPAPEPPPAAIAPPEGELAAHWTFDDGDGVHAADAAGTLTGLLVGEPQWTGGRAGGALGFNGLDAYVSIPDADALNPAALTLSAWILLAERPARPACILSKGYRLRIGPDLAADFLGARASVPVGAWTHLAATADASGVRFYVNGRKLAAAGPFSPGRADGLNLRIGGDPDLREFFKGAIDDVRVYRRALSPAEVHGLFLLR